MSVNMELSFSEEQLIESDAYSLAQQNNCLPSDIYAIFNGTYVLERISTQENYCYLFSQNDLFLQFCWNCADRVHNYSVGWSRQFSRFCNVHASSGGSSSGKNATEFCNEGGLISSGTSIAFFSANGGFNFPYWRSSGTLSVAVSG